MPDICMIILLLEFYDLYKVDGHRKAGREWIGIGNTFNCKKQRYNCRIRFPFFHLLFLLHIP